VIIGCRINIFKKISKINPFPDYDHIETVINNLCLAKKELNDPSQQKSFEVSFEPQYITLDNIFVPAKHCKKYLI
jgi:hypothetical protein